MVWRKAVALAVAAVAATPAAARTFCCTDDNGRRVCGDLVPLTCQKRAYQEMNSQGVVSRHYDPPLTAEQRAQQRAEAARKLEDERRAAEQRRLDEALRASYSNVNDIDAKRDRLLTDAQSNLKAAEESYQAALARKQELAAEMEFYDKKPVPGVLRNQIRDNQADIDSQQSFIEAKRKEITAIRARFEDEKRRYLSLSGQPLPPLVIPGRPR